MPTIRHALPEEAGILGEFRLRMFRSMGVADDARLSALASVQDPWTRQALTDGRMTGLVAESDGEVVGALQIAWVDLPPSLRDLRGRKAYLLGLYVVPAARQGGVARALVERAIEEARAGGVELITLHASDAGRPLYEKLGFEPTSEMRLLTSAGR